MIEPLFIRTQCFDHGRGRRVANRSRAAAVKQQHAISSSCILGCMLKANGGCTRRVLSGTGGVPIAHNKDKDNGNGGGGGVGVGIDDNDDNDNAVRRGIVFVRHPRHCTYEHGQ